MDARVWCDRDDGRSSGSVNGSLSASPDHRPSEWLLREPCSLLIRRGTPSQYQRSSPARAFRRNLRARVDVMPFLRRLSRSGMWKWIEVHQFGPDRTAALAEPPPRVKSVFHAPRPWSDVIGTTRDFDAAIAIGNLNPAQLPSKVIDYLVLPVPRIAITANPQLDATARYVADKVGWLVMSPDDPEGPGRVRRTCSGAGRWKSFALRSRNRGNVSVS